MKISIYLTLGIAVLFLLGGIGIGYYFTSDYQIRMYDKSAMDLGAADRSFDLRYINAMIAHHRGAMLLAEQLGQNTEREEMKSLALGILEGEPKLIAELYAWKKDWYGDIKRVRDPQVANLGSKDAKFDLRFLNAIIAHHELGIKMTQETRIKSSRAEILNNADAVEAFLGQGLETLKGFRGNWYNL
jgi:uncharacterized protein (DUF305 family)